MRGKSTDTKETVSVGPPPGRSNGARPARSAKAATEKSLWPKALSDWRSNHPKEQKFLAVLGLGIVLGVGLSLMLTYVLCLMVGFLAGYWWAKR